MCAHLKALFVFISCLQHKQCPQCINTDPPIISSRKVAPNGGGAQSFFETQMLDRQSLIDEFPERVNADLEVKVHVFCSN